MRRPGVAWLTSARSFHLRCPRRLALVVVMLALVVEVVLVVVLVVLVLVVEVVLVVVLVVVVLVLVQPLAPTLVELTQLCVPERRQPIS